MGGFFVVLNMINELVTQRVRLSEADPLVRIVNQNLAVLKHINSNPSSFFMLDQQLFCYLGEGRRSKTFLTRSMFDGMKIVKIRKDSGASFVEEARLLSEIKKDIGDELKNLGILLPAYSLATKDFAFVTYFHGRYALPDDFGIRFDDFKSLVSRYRLEIKKRPWWTGKDLDLQENPFNKEDFIVGHNGKIAWVDPIAFVRLYGV